MTVAAEKIAELSARVSQLGRLAAFVKHLGDAVRQYEQRMSTLEGRVLKLERRK